jgi:hypothetical protein
MTRFVPTLLVLLVSAPQLCAGPYDDLLKLVPPGTNTLLLANVKGAFATPLGKSEKWADDYFHRYRAGIGFVPPDAELVVIASEVNLSSMARDYQIGLVKVKNLPNMKELAVRVGGTTDRLADQVCTLSPLDAYYVGLPGTVLAGVYPANRQAATRWLKHAMKSTEVHLSPYLKQAAENAGDNTVVVAIDLADSAEPALLRAGLPTSPAVIRQKSTNIEALSKFVASVQGMTLSIKVGSTISATLRVDFSFEVDFYKRIARELFLEVLDQQGAAVPGMTGWETTYGEKSMTLTGALTTTDLRHILSLFAFPGPTDDEPKDVVDAVSVPATKRYLAAVDVILGDLRKAKNTPDYAKTATWNEKAAAQLDMLNRRAVDPIAVAAAYDAAKRLRALAGSLRGIPIRLDELSSKSPIAISPNVGIMTGGWWGVRPIVNAEIKLPEIWAAQQKVIDDDKQRRVEVWIQIDELLADARQRLSDKHKTRF